MAPFKVHLVRFYDPDPKAIQCMVANEQGDLLALSRGDSSIEIWNVAHTPYLQKQIPGTPEGSTESLCWYENRLFSCGLHGFVLEHDVERLNPKSQQAVTSGPAWCLAANNETKMIAVGTEEGFVNLYSILSDSLVYDRILDKQEGRILCISWNPKGTHLATGSVDTIRVWNVDSGQPIARMTTGRSSKNKETIVWSVAMNNNLTVISGDSQGRTSFWNGNNGTLMESIHGHKADVLTVELNPDGNRAYSSGIDPTIMHFQLISKNNGTKKWVKSIHRCVNTHDVRSLVCSKDKIYSGGVDTYLTISNYLAKSVTRVPPIPFGGVIELARHAGIFLLKYSTYLEVWRLGETEQETGMLDCNLFLSKEPVRLLQLHSKDGEQITCSTISEDGCWIAYTTQTTSRVFRLNGVAEGEDKLSLSKIKFAEKDFEIPLQMAFTKDGDGNTCLVVGSVEGSLQVFSVSQTTLYRCWSLLSDELHLSSPVHLLSVTGRMAVISDLSGNIVAIDLDREAVISKLPIFKEACLTAMAVSPDEKTCLLVYSNQKLVEVDIKTSKFTQFSNGFNQKLHRDWTSRRLPVTGISYMSADLILLHDDEYLIVVDKEKEIQEPETKLHITDPIFNPDESQDSSIISSSPCSSYKPDSSSNVNCLRMNKKFYHLLGVRHLKDNSIVCLEMKPSTIEEKLPPSLRVKKFGAQ